MSSGKAGSEDEVGGDLEAFISSVYRDDFCKGGLDRFGLSKALPRSVAAVSGGIVEGEALLVWRSAATP